MEKSAFARKIDLLMAEKNLTHKQVAKKAGIQRQALHQLKKSKHPRMTTLHRLSRAFEVPITVFYDSLY